MVKGKVVALVGAIGPALGNLEVFRSTGRTFIRRGDGVYINEVK